MIVILFFCFERVFRYLFVCRSFFRTCETCENLNIKNFVDSSYSSSQGWYEKFKKRNISVNCFDLDNCHSFLWLLSIVDRDKKITNIKEILFIMADEQQNMAPMFVFQPNISKSFSDISINQPIDTLFSHATRYSKRRPPKFDGEHQE